MVLSKTAEYALRAVCCIAKSGDTPMRAVDIAEICNIPPTYLSKLLRKLTQEGVLVSKAGHRGGFILGQSADMLSFEDVLYAIGARVEEDRCLFGLGSCEHLETHCPLHESACELNSRVNGWAKNSRISDLLGSDA